MDRKKVGKSRPGIIYFSTEPETFLPISNVSTVHLVHFYPEWDKSRKISSTYCSFFNGNGKKFVNFWQWTVLPGKIRSHSAQVRWRLTEQIPFTYRHFWKCLAGIVLRIFLNETGVSNIYLSSCLSVWMHWTARPLDQSSPNLVWGPNFTRARS